MISRRMQRQYAVQTLYATIVQHKKSICIDDFTWIRNVSVNDISYALSLYTAAFSNIRAIDKIWHKSSGRSAKIIYQCDACILRVALAELYYIDTTIDFAIVVQEYVKIAKLLSSDNSYKFINGVLNTVYHVSLETES